MKPAAMPTQPGRMPLNTKTAPSAIMNSDAEPMIGQAIGCGTA
jgi:hypothetical protein